MDGSVSLFLSAHNSYCNVSLYVDANVSVSGCLSVMVRFSFYCDLKHRAAVAAAAAAASAVVIISFYFSCAFVFPHTDSLLKFRFLSVLIAEWVSLSRRTGEQVKKRFPSIAVDKHVVFRNENDREKHKTINTRKKPPSTVFHKS